MGGTEEIKAIAIVAKAFPGIILIGNDDVTSVDVVLGECVVCHGSVVGCRDGFFIHERCKNVF